MVLAFSRERADFSGMLRQRAWLSTVAHKAFVAVDERGTEAAAASGAVMRVLSAVPRHAVVRADHPFFFVIRDRRTGSLLFAGRLSEPAA
jgi:serpin B